MDITASHCICDLSEETNTAYIAKCAWWEVEVYFGAEAIPVTDNFLSDRHGVAGVQLPHSDAQLIGHKSIIFEDIRDNQLLNNLGRRLWKLIDTLVKLYKGSSPPLAKHACLQNTFWFIRLPPSLLPTSPDLMANWSTGYTSEASTTSDGSCIPRTDRAMGLVMMTRKVLKTLDFLYYSPHTKCFEFDLA